MLAEYVKIITERALAKRENLETHAKAKVDCAITFTSPESISAGHQKQPKSDLVQNPVARYAKAMEQLLPNNTGMATQAVGSSGTKKKVIKKQKAKVSRKMKLRK